MTALVATVAVSCDGRVLVSECLSEVGGGTGRRPRWGNSHLNSCRISKSIWQEIIEGERLSGSCLSIPFNHGRTCGLWGLVVVDFWLVLEVG